MDSLNDIKPRDEIYIYRASSLGLSDLILYDTTGRWRTTVSYVNADYVILNKYWQCILINCEEIIIDNG